MNYEIELAVVKPIVKPAVNFFEKQIEKPVIKSNKFGEIAVIDILTDLRNLRQQFPELNDDDSDKSVSDMQSPI